jgi:hypothetical protein
MFSYLAIVYFTVLIKGSNKLQSYLVMNLLRLFWYLTHVEPTVRNDNSMHAVMIEDSNLQYIWKPIF